MIDAPRRLFVLGGLALSSSALAQQSASPFVGRWTGHVRGLGDAEMVVVGVRANGQVDGTMTFPEQNRTFKFGDKLDIANSINLGVVDGSTLTIETSMGGTYNLALANGQLSGEYVRGTTYKVHITFSRSM
jgi:redox-regulated HSP33 family molecular chaperone